jgi:hypothetical protein
MVRRFTPVQLLVAVWQNVPRQYDIILPESKVNPLSSVRRLFHVLTGNDINCGRKIP